jgi:eukaryotic-like serine/threonine-protein kinase
MGVSPQRTATPKRRPRQPALDLSIWVTSIFGDAPRQLRTNAKSASVSPQGSAIAFVDAYNHELWVMDANGENQRKVFSSEHDRCMAPIWSPTGQRIAFIKPQSMGGRFGGSIETIALDGGAPSTVLSDAGLLASGSIANRLLWLRDGRLIFTKSERRKLEDSNLWQVMTNPQTGRVSGQTEKITNWSGVAPILLSASKDGSRLAVTRTHSFDDVYVGELKHNGTVLGSPGRLTVSDSENYADTWTPDSKALLFESDRMGRIQIFRQRMEKDSPEHFIQGSNDEHAATFSPDGAWILHWTTSDDSGTPAERRRLNRLSISGGAPEQVLEVPAETTPNFDCPAVAGDMCVLSGVEQGHLIFFALDPFHGVGKELARTDGTENSIPWSLSPDGTRVAVATRDHESLRLVDLRNGTGQTLKLSPVFIWSLRWAADGTAVFAAVSRSTEYLIVRIELDGTTRVLLNRGRTQWLASPRPSPDGHYLAFSQQTFQTNVWLLENF